MTQLRIVLFDVDGVLLDSLVPHLRICADKNLEYGLGLTIPEPQQLKRMAHHGVRISPMKYFFMAVGFPENYAEKADRQYQEVFMRNYTPKPFAGVYETLKTLCDLGFLLGIVTSNIKANIVDALGPSLQFFHPDCILAKDSMPERNGAEGSSKPKLIMAAMAALDAQPSEVLFVGDQLADWQAAKAAGVNFLGAAYGWGISEDDKDFPVISKISEVLTYIADHESGDRVRANRLAMRPL
jgi:N-acetyl-D-muramate 6-phosphate phosphatase